MRRILIYATQEIATKLEEKLRHYYDVEVELLPNAETSCKIDARIKGSWLTICRFACNENIKDILTMFNVNYGLKSGENKKN